MANGKISDELRPQDIDNVYGAMNSLEPDSGPIADRNVTTSTDALLTVISEIYTPNTLKNKNQFNGIVLYTKPSAFPLRESKDAYWEALAVQEAGSSYEWTGGSLYYYYYVLIPELEPTPIDWDDKESIPKRIATFDLTYMSVELVNAGLNKRITPGTKVTVQFGDTYHLKQPNIIDIGPLIFSFDITGLVSKENFPYGRPASLLGAVGRDGDHVNPRGNSGQMSAANAHLAPAKHTPDDIKKCSDRYDSDTSIGGSARAKNDKKILLLHPEAQPYCKCFIVRCHDNKIKISLNSTGRTNEWQMEHRRCWVEGKACQTILCAKGNADPGVSTKNVQRGSNGIIGAPTGGSWHLAGFAWDFNPTITTSDGKKVTLRNASSSTLWDNSGIGEIANSLGLWWGGGGPTGEDINDQIHVGGGSILKRLTNSGLNAAYKVLHATQKQGRHSTNIDIEKWKQDNPNSGTP